MSVVALMNQNEAFDPAQEALIEPGKVVAAVPDFPKVAVTTFAKSIIDGLVARENPPVIGNLHMASGDYPVYRLVYKGVPVAVYLSMVGAPPSAAQMEEVIAMGARAFLAFGSCGVLNAGIAAQQVMVPTQAVRDEGTSHHYLPPAEVIDLDAACVAAVTDTLRLLGCQCAKGKVWTTDAFYRETREKMKRRAGQGCVAVDMECSALAAVARFRGVKYGQFLFTDDNLDAPEWERRTLGKNGDTHSGRYMMLAMECALRLAEGL